MDSKIRGLESASLGFLRFSGLETDSLTKLLRVTRCLRARQFSSAGLGLRLSGTAQGAESLVNRAKKRFERIGCAELDVDTSDAHFEPSCNLKES